MSFDMRASPLNLGASHIPVFRRQYVKPSWLRLGFANPPITPERSGGRGRQHKTDDEYHQKEQHHAYHSGSSFGLYAATIFACTCGGTTS